MASFLRDARRPGHDMAAPTATSRVVGWWLLVLCAMVVVMVLLGGYTRLTHSGLSMVRWHPQTLLPPTSESAWQAAFDDYRRYPEYAKINSGMDLAGFKEIYWPEYIHRVWGRLIAFVLVVPFLSFLVRGAIARPMRWRIAGVIVLGGLQGVIGWLMVSSGMVDRPDVSHYRLALHLLAAFAIYAWMLWLALGILLAAGPEPGVPRAASSNVRRLVGAVGVMTVATATWGAFTAGLDAGFIFNRFPLMGDRPWPNSLGPGSPILAALEQPGVVQFVHRVLATTTLVLALWLAVRAWRSGLPARLVRVVLLVPAATLLQFVLGVSTLLLVVPTGLGVVHQAGALVLLTAVITALAVLHEPRAEARAERRIRPFRFPRNRLVSTVDLSAPAHRAQGAPHVRFRRLRDHRLRRQSARSARPRGRR